MMRIEVPRLHAWMRLAGLHSMEQKLTITSRGWYTSVVDPAHIALIVLLMPADRFEDFDVPEGTKYELGLDTDGYLSTELRAIKRGTAEINVETDEDGNIFFITKKEPLKFRKRAIDPKAITRHKIPSIVYPLIMEIPVMEFSEFTEAARLFAKRMLMQYENGTLTLRAGGEGYQTVLESEIPVKVVHEGVEKAWAYYTLDWDYLTGLMRLLRQLKADKAYLSFGTEKPLRLEFEVEGIAATYFLAPRVE